MIIFAPDPYREAEGLGRVVLREGNGWVETADIEAEDNAAWDRYWDERTAGWYALADALDEEDDS